jgi:hypothetical protein
MGIRLIMFLWFSHAFPSLRKRLLWDTSEEVIGSPTPNFAKHPAAVPAVPVPSAFAWKKMSGLANLKASVPFYFWGGDSISKMVDILYVIDDIVIL